MRNRFGIGFLIVSILTVVGAFAAWRLRNPPRVRRFNRSSIDPTRITSFGSMSGSPRNTMGSISNESRFFATQAVKAGPAYVSFRRIALDDGTGKPQQGVAQSSGQYGPFFLLLQVLPGSSSSGRQVRIDPQSLKAIDDNHHVSRHTPSKADGAWAIDGGMVYQYRMEAPGANAAAITSLECNVQVTEGGDSHSYPCAITNIPLPSAVRMFGRVAPRIIEPNAAAKLPAGPSLATGNQNVDKLVASTTAVPLSVPTGPQRLLVGDRLPVRIGVPLPNAPLSVGFTATPTKFGAVDMEFELSGSRLKTRSWDLEPVVLVLPKSSDSPRYALVIRLGLELPAPEPANVAPLYAPESGRSGGAIESGVKVEGKPFGRGFLTIGLSRKSGSGWTEPRRTTVPLNTAGGFSLPNLAPGEYQIERPVSGLFPNVPGGTPQGTIEEYIRERFGAIQGKWERDNVQPLIVRAGQTTVVPPLQFVTSKSASVGNDNR